MGKGKVSIKELRLIGAAMADMKVASELGRHGDKVSKEEQATPNLMDQSQQSSQNEFQQQAEMHMPQRFEQLAQQAKEQLIKVKNLFN